MIKTDISHKQKTASEASPFFAFPTVLHGLYFGVLGAFVNAFLAINYLGNFSLYFGQMFVLFCLVTRGLNAALFTVLITSTVAAIYANDPYLICIYTLEMLVVHLCLRKGYFLFESAIGYWLLVGTPLLFTLYALTSLESIEFLFISGVTRALNGLICVSLVAIVCWFIPANRIHFRYNATSPKFSSLIYSLCMLTVTLPALVVALFFIWQSATSNEQYIEKELKNTSLQIAAINNLELDLHLSSLQTVATYIQNNPQARRQPLIEATADTYALFESVVLTNDIGKITRAAPAHHSAKWVEQYSSLTSVRKFFNDARIAPNAFVTDALVTKGYDNQAIIGFVAPYTVSSAFDGIVLGAVPLEQLVALNDKNINDEYLYVITDNKKRVIARSNSLEMPLLSNFDYTLYDEPLIKNVPSLMFNQTVYLYHQSETENGWTITVMTPPHSTTSMLVDYFLLLILSVFFVLSLFAVITRAVSRKITKPLVDISENFPDAEFHPQMIKESQVSTEIVKLTHKLIDTHAVMSNFRQQLSEQVHNKTKQLKQLNKELYTIAQKDSLTQLLNRAGFNRQAISSYRNCVRNHINMSLIFVDIDHFKMINDTHGHPFGDKCIVAVAKTIQKHCKRDTDILGRYGGEEFIIMIVGGDIKEHSDRITLIKDEIEKLTLQNNGDVIKMTISAGICSLGNDFSIEYEDLLQLSDNQLYISKREGRNKISSIIR